MMIRDRWPLARTGLRLRHAGVALAAVVFNGLFGSAAHAVPSYARQTGADCAACHVGGFGPQMTPYGIQFKLGGYTDTDGKEGKVPLSAMVVANTTRTSRDTPEPVARFSANNNTAMQEMSGFLAGKMTEHIGAFVQATYSGVERKTSLDQMDVRYARTVQLGGKESTIGLSVNNNPSLTDPFNTMGQWRFPYTSSDFGFGTGPSPMVENVGGGVVGLNAYTLWDKNYYAELGLYNTLSESALRRINAGDPGKFKGAGTYWRVAYFKDRKRDNFSAGLFGFGVGVQPDRTVLGTADRYQDVGIDAGYQFLGNRQHIFAVNGSYVRESQKLNYTHASDGADNLRNSLNQFKVAASYHYDQTWGVTGSLFNTRSSADAVLNAGAYNGRSNTAGYTLQADWTPWGKESSWGAPWANVRLGAQYTGYTKFQGGSSYIDANGNDRRARDNNTLSLFVWMAI